MTVYFIIIIANLLVGGMIGLTGIAGFLLPMLYSGFLGMPAAQGLALSFFAFLISGVLGAYNYYKARNLDLKLALVISAGSLIGAVLGVRLNLMIDEAIVKRILYLVVLASGISILLRKESDKKNAEAGKSLTPGLSVVFGAVTGALCALSGAGGTNPGDAPSGRSWGTGKDCGGGGAVELRVYCNPFLHWLQPAVRSAGNGGFAFRVNGKPWDWRVGG